jgi:hypothetical protein
MPDRPWRAVSRPRGGALLALFVLAGLLLGLGSRPANANFVGSIEKNQLDPRSATRELIDELVANNFRIVRPAVGSVGTVNTSGVNSQGNHQVNDPSLDKIQTFPGTPPFELATESETSMVSLGNSDLVVGYNSSAGTNFVDAQGDVSQILFSGFSVSHDGGSTWRSGFVPPLPGSVFTFGDPSLASDRAGNVYYTSITVTPRFHFGLQINKSSDRGDTWSPGRLVVQDDGADKEWLAIGPDPAVPSRDNVYVTWTSFTRNGSELWLARSIDGGTSWTTKRLFAPHGTSLMSPFIQFSNPTVDASTGRLYIPFLHFSNFDADFIKVLVSDDGGQSFRFLNFNVPGAPETTGFPNVTPGSLEDCGELGGPRLALHAGPATIGGLFGLPRWVQTTRIITQPAAAAANGRLFIALNSSTNPTFGAGTGSAIRVLYSPNGGTSWAAPVTVAPSTSSDVQHIHPALTLDSTGGVHVIYYVQDSSEKLRVDGVSGQVVGDHVSFGAPSHVSTGSWNLTPSNITVSPTLTLNFDSVVVPCYDIGEYPSVTSSPAGAVAAWGDSRKLWKEPDGALISGTHSQADVFFDRAP